MGFENNKPDRAQALKLLASLKWETPPHQTFLERYFSDSELAFLSDSLAVASKRIAYQINFAENQSKTQVVLLSYYENLSLWRILIRNIQTERFSAKITLVNSRKYVSGRKRFRDAKT